MSEDTAVRRRPTNADERDAVIARVMERYPPAETISSAEFERFVADVLRAAGSESFEVTDPESIRGSDGSYDFDATARFEIAGMRFLVLVEAKRHKHPIKRELVQALHQKMLSVGASKALLVAAGRFQSGAIEFAFSHGIALATLSEGRLTYETRSSDPSPELSVDQARVIGMLAYSAMITRRDPTTGRSARPRSPPPIRTSFWIGSRDRADGLGGVDLPPPVLGSQRNIPFSLVLVRSLVGRTMFWPTNSAFRLRISSDSLISLASSSSYAGANEPRQQRCAMKAESDAWTIYSQ